MKLKCFLFMILLINIVSINIYSKDKYSEDVIKIGVYENTPYYSIDSKGKVSGYYDDFLNILQENSNFKYEYIIYSFEDGIKDLEDGKIDIMLGVSITPQRIDKLIFSNNFIAIENFVLLTNKNITFDDLKNIKDVKVGLVKGATNIEMILNFFLDNKIDVDPVYVKSTKELEQLLKTKKVDIILHNNYMETDFKLLYKIQGDQVYIAANKDESDILEKMDKQIEKIRTNKTDSISNLYNKYFNEDYKNLILRQKLLSIILIICMLIISVLLTIPKIKKHKVQNKIRLRMSDNKYLLQYQPIYNPRNNNIVGFEGLLRLLDENSELIPPYKFIPEIEKNNMLFDISLWVLERVINDYNDIKTYNCVKGQEFYISLNVSLQEIENDLFIKKSINMLNESNLGANKVCLEIIERVKINDLDKISKNINNLKHAGFKIAIDDFGVEYSNLDILHILDTDVIKVDKNFVDGIDKDEVKNEIILFISKIAKAKNKAVVLEGVEKKEQYIRIKEIENDKIYVQGYFYNKPMYKEDIKKL